MSTGACTRGAPIAMKVVGQTSTSVATDRWSTNLDENPESMWGRPPGLQRVSRPAWSGKRWKTGDRQRISKTEIRTLPPLFRLDQLCHGRVFDRARGLQAPPAHESLNGQAGLETRCRRGRLPHCALPKRPAPSLYCSAAYSFFTSASRGISGSASFHNARKS
jgi:hypothetical protein